MKINPISLPFFITSLLRQHVIAHDPPPDYKGCVPDENGNFARYKNVLTREQMTSIIGNRVECVDNDAGGFPCSNVHMESFIAFDDLFDITSQATMANGGLYSFPRSLIS